jgi:hypothetical protein
MILPGKIDSLKVAFAVSHYRRHDEEQETGFNGCCYDPFGNYGAPTVVALIAD